MSGFGMPAGGGLIDLTQSAAERIVHLRKQEGDDGLALRISVNGGGCSGFTYQFSFDPERKDDDMVVERDDAVLLVDAMSLPFLAGSQVDYVEDLIGSYFAVKNPNAVSMCGCGSSFSVG